MATYLCTNSYAGYREIPVEVIGRTPKRYRIKLLKDCRLPGSNRAGKEGQIILVPQLAIRIEKDGTQIKEKAE